jgi:hypothetical protein
MKSSAALEPAYNKSRGDFVGYIFGSALLGASARFSVAF